MRKILLVTIVVIMVAVWGGIALAADTNTLTVTATVLGVCKFNTAAETLAFGTLDPSSAANGTGTATATFWCTNGTTGTLAAGQGLYYSSSNRMRSAAHTTAFIPYSLGLSPTSTTGSGKSTPITLTITGTVLNADYINALQTNDYTDTVSVTITP
ncbi:MAG: spore coat protein U domain-containing protein [Syntrophales bacterium]|jgi:spore coat protein U-like protein